MVPRRRGPAIPLQRAQPLCVGGPHAAVHTGTRKTSKLAQNRDPDYMALRAALEVMEKVGRDVFDVLDCVFIEVLQDDLR